MERDHISIACICNLHRKPFARKFLFTSLRHKFPHCGDCPLLSALYSNRCGTAASGVRPPPSTSSK